MSRADSGERIKPITKKDVGIFREMVRHKVNSWNESEPSRPLSLSFKNGAVIIKKEYI